MEKEFETRTDNSGLFLQNQHTHPPQKPEEMQKVTLIPIYKYLPSVKMLHVGSKMPSLPCRHQGTAMSLTAQLYVCHHKSKCWLGFPPLIPGLQGYVPCSLKLSSCNFKFDIWHFRPQCSIFTLE